MNKQQLNQIRFMQEEIKRSILSGKLSESVSVRLKSGHHFSVYIDGFRARLYASLRDDFPLVEARLGSQTFVNLLESFITKTNSVYTSIAQYSELFPKFLYDELAEQGDLAAAEACYLLAIQDWMEILSLRSVPTAISQHEIGVEQIEQGEPFVLQTHHAVVFCRLQILSQDRYFLSNPSPNKLDEQFFSEISERQFALLELLENHGLDVDNHLSDKILDQWSPHELQEQISAWIANKVIVCVAPAIK